MTDEEKIGLEELKARVVETKLKAYEHMRMLWTWSGDISVTGHKSKEAGVISAFQSAEREIEKLNKAFLKRFPD